MSGLVSWFTLERISVCVAGFSLMCTVWAVLVSRRSVGAAVRSAAAAEAQAEAAVRQADAAVHQVREAYAQSSVARKVAEVEALASAKARIEEAVPNVSLVVSPISRSPVVIPVNDSPPFPHPDIVERGERVLAYPQCRDDLVYFVLQGKLRNYDNGAVRVHSSSVRFYESKDPATGVDLPVPMWSEAEGCHILEPGQAALFQVLMLKQIDGFLNRVDNMQDGADERPFSRDTIMFQPGHVDEPHLLVTLTSYATPFRSHYGANPRTSLATNCGSLHIVVKRKLYCPDFFERLHAELTNDEDKIYALNMFNQLEALENRNKGSYTFGA